MGQCDDKDCLNEIVDTMLEIQCSMREYNAVAGDEYLESLFKERLKRTDNTPDFRTCIQKNP